MLSEIEQNIKIAYQTKLQQQTLLQGRVLGWIGLILLIAVLFIDYYNQVNSRILVFRFLTFIVIAIYTAASYIILPKETKKQYIIPGFVGMISAYTLHMAGVGYIVYSSAAEHVELLRNFSLGFMATILVCSIFSYGGKRQLSFNLPAIVVAYSILLLGSGIYELRHLVIINTAAITSAIFMKRQLELDFVSFRTIKLLEESQEALQEKNQELDAVNKQLLSVNRALSHDINTPLRNIGSFAQLLDREIKKELKNEGEEKSKRIKEYLNFITDGVQYMYKLLDDILSYSKLSQHQKQVSIPIDLNVLFTKIKKNYHQTLIERKAILAIKEPLPIINGDEVYLYLLFQNLIDNGLKYNNSQAPHISIESKEETNRFIISITDNGIGIDKDYHQKIFEVFERLNTNEKYKGTGIGLATCKEIVAQLNGEIWLESVVDKGSTFYLAFPKIEELTV